MEPSAKRQDRFTLTKRKKQNKIVLSDGGGSCMETLLKLVLRKVRGGYPLESILSRSGIRVIYLVFRKLCT